MATPARWTWETTDTGFVLVDQGSGPAAIELPGPDASTARTEGWLDLAKRHAAMHQIPLSWVLAVIYSESGGNPGVRNSCCAGLMALSLAVYKLTEAEAFDPETNVHLGAQTLGTYRAKGWQLPETASMYNAGPSSVTGGPKAAESDPWGFVENRPAVPWTGYIEKVVRASNWWRRRELAGELGTVTPVPPPPSPGTPPPPVLAAATTAGGPFAWMLAAVASFTLVRRWLKKKKS
jgi:hypothetical protein